MKEIELREKVVNPVIAEAEEIEVESTEDYEFGSEYLKRNKKIQKQVFDYWAEPKAQAHKAWKSIIKKEKEMLSPLQKAESIVKAKMLAYEWEQKRRKEEEERKLQEIANKKAEQERQRLLKRAEKIKTPEKKEALIEQANQVVTPVVTCEVEVPKVEGISTRTTWKAKVIDKKAFVQAALGNPNLMAMIVINTSALDKIAKATKGEVEYPGVVFYEQKTMGVRNG